MLKSNGGVFGRNPTFNNVTVEGTLYLNGEAFSGLDYQGSWNASSNTPTLTSSVGTRGAFYIVGTAGSTTLNGISNWGVGDWVVFDGSVWQRVEGGAAGNFTNLSATGVASFATGSVGSPSITHLTDTDTGFYFTTNGGVNVASNGAALAFLGPTQVDLMRKVAMRTTQGTIQLASGASVDYVAAAGLVMVYNATNGSGGVFFTNFSASPPTKIAGTGEVTDTGSTFAVYKSAATSTFTVKNKAATQQSFYVMVLAVE